MMFLKKLHKWVGLLIGIQVVLWLGSGLVISLLDPSKVSGKQWAQPPAETQRFQFENILEVQDLPGGILKNALSVDLTVFRKQPVYEIRHPDSVTLINAVTGESFQFGEANATTLALEGFEGTGEVVSITKGTAPDMETRNHTGPYWRVDFSDTAESSYYISAWTGDILERRNKYWRTHDFFWMLHIMDYRDHEDINNSLVIGVALVAVWLGISGFILLFSSFSRHDFWFLNFTGHRKQVLVSLTGSASVQPLEIKLRKGGNLFLTLANQGVELPSKCGGGGECGKCRVMVTAGKLAEPNAVERKLLAKALLNKGFRLACQQKVTNHVTLDVPGDTLIEPGKAGL